jgi:MSHA biogenesis protein MshN
MSLINKMLQDLDRRNAMADASPAPQPVRPIGQPARGRDRFWWIVAALMIGAAGWMGWVAWNIFAPREPLATPAAYAVEKQAKARPRTVEQKLEEPKPEPVAKAEPQVPVETLRLAHTIDTPFIKPAAKPERARKAAAEGPVAQAPRPQVVLADKPKIERRELVAPASERAEVEFRAAAELLRQGRAAQAEAGFLGALKIDPSHRGARQALVALHLERGQLETARRLLEEGLNIDPSQPDFSVALARILVERKDFAGALAALQASEAAAGAHAEHHFLRGTVLQRLGRHQEAADAYRNSLQVQQASARSWIGLGISLEALQHRAEASEAFKRALAAGPADAELRSFAEQRIRALR